MKPAFHQFAAIGALAISLFAGQALANEAAKTAKPDTAKGQAIVTQVCASCHGADGNSTSPTYPRLAGQHPEYLVKQLSNFKTKAGAKEAERANAVMAGFASTLSDDDMKNVAAYLSSQEAKPGAAKNKETVSLGQKIYRGGIAEKNVPACAGCHSPNGAGIPAQYPRLSGQHADYTESQLVGFRAGTRKNSPQMLGISARLSDKEIKAVADYIAGMR
ncbi:c-type cytochrome [Ampullimonas aquatilis]|uniref:c-type cytochrome n=1 Tax=Ampullimonas aquatilis TaxID=1341549 RepID=UPI003C74C82D